jgi:hypothetical protein
MTLNESAKIPTLEIAENILPKTICRGGAAKFPRGLAAAVAG